MRDRIQKAIEVAIRYGQIDGDHHKAWVIDQMIRELTGCPTVTVTNPHSANGPFEHDALGESEEYNTLIREACEGEDGLNTYDWDTGTAP